MNITIIHTGHPVTHEIDVITRAIPGELEARAGYHRLHHAQPARSDALASLRARLGYDINPLPPDFDPTQVRLLVTDMDSTLINIECIDEIAGFAGLKPQVSAITEAAMRGELNFEQSLTQRVQLLAGLDSSILQRVYDELLKLNPGAETMLACLTQRRIKTALVSGGFTFFTSRLQQRLGLDYSRANVLEMDAKQLSGRVVGAIVGAQAKADFLSELCGQLHISRTQTLAMGDGANDLNMMQLAGLSIAYHAKPKVQMQAKVVINHGTLAAVCHLLN
ncbi:MAG: phosphoserine phosphatase SerB [Gammaproteobacteria bacterium]|nr:phosphoserine phosphatase SerB [Gammaproteobacteria bacterium]